MFLARLPSTSSATITLATQSATFWEGGFLRRPCVAMGTLSSSQAATEVAMWGNMWRCGMILWLALSLSSHSHSLSISYHFHCHSHSHSHSYPTRTMTLTAISHLSSLIWLLFSSRVDAHSHSPPHSRSHFIPTYSYLTLTLTHSQLTLTSTLTLSLISMFDLALLSLVRRLCLGAVLFHRGSKIAWPCVMFWSKLKGRAYASRSPSPSLFPGSHDEDSRCVLFKRGW
jgi:hypothetical protein